MNVLNAFKIVKTTLLLFWHWKFGKLDKNLWLQTVQMLPYNPILKNLTETDIDPTHFKNELFQECLDRLPTIIKIQTL